MTRPLPLHTAALLMLAGAAALPARAQAPSAPAPPAQAPPAPTLPASYVRLGAQAVQPLGGLRERFGATGTAALAYGWAIAPTRTMEVGLTGVRFRKGALQLAPDTTGSGAGSVDPDSLALSLSLAGGFVRVHQQIGQGRIAPRVSLGAGLVRWVDRRGAYPSRGLTTTARRAQWSGQLDAGLGADVALSPRLALTLDAAYHLLPADLWGAQRVRLAPVSTFQFATAGAGLRLHLGR